MYVWRACICRLARKIQRDVPILYCSMPVLAAAYLIIGYFYFFVAKQSEEEGCIFFNVTKNKCVCPTSKFFDYCHIKHIFPIENCYI